MKKKYTFVEGDRAAADHGNYNPAIFNRSSYGDLQSAHGWRTFCVVCEDEMLACMRFCLIDGVARSPLRAPFGSFDTKGSLSPEIVFNFLTFVEEQLKRAGVSEIVIKNPPDLYNPELMTLLSNFFLTHQYRVSEAEIGAVIPVSERPFPDVIHPRKKRKLHQSRTETLKFLRLERTALPVVYNFIAARRSEKNYRLSISVEELGRFIDRFPNNYLLFAVVSGQEILAASVAIRVREHVLYHFISDHVRKIGVLRPALILMEGIYDYCRLAGITLLDLGTSTLDGQADVKLLRFKTEIGGHLTHKFTFAKTIV